MVASIDFVGGELIPHLGPFGVVDIKVFHSTALGNESWLTYFGLLNKFVKKVVHINDFKGFLLVKTEIFVINISNECRLKLHIVSCL